MGDGLAKVLSDGEKFELEKLAEIRDYLMERVSGCTQVLNNGSTNNAKAQTAYERRAKYQGVLNRLYREFPELKI